MRLWFATLHVLKRNSCHASSASLLLDRSQLLCINSASSFESAACLVLLICYRNNSGKYSSCMDIVHFIVHGFLELSDAPPCAGVVTPVLLHKFSSSTKKTDEWWFESSPTSAKIILRSCKRCARYSHLCVFDPRLLSIVDAQMSYKWYALY